MSFMDKINRFASNPVNMNMKRSKFNLSHGVKTTFNSGVLVPLLCDEVLPDDTIKLDVASVVRSITPAFPVMDNAYLDLYCFWVPARIATVHEKDFQKIFGENTNGFWAPSAESTLDNTGNTFPISSTAPVAAQSLGNYMGLPIGYYNTNIKLSRLPFNGYWMIWNEWFRDQNTQAPIDWKSFNATNMFEGVCNPLGTGNSKLCSVNKFHDYFTSALPSPQKGNSVLLPLAGSAPVITKTTDIYSSVSAISSVPNLRFIGSTQLPANNKAPLTIGNAGSGASYISEPGVGSSSSGAGTSKLIPNNLYADLTNASAASVNDLRQAFAIQKLLEKDARGGTRYREMLKAHFGVSIPDNTVQIPEYLGGKRIPLNMLQVLQTAEGTSSPVGNTGAFSNTADNSYLCTKSFAEFGYIYVLGVVRPNQTYSQGVSKMFFRNRRYDFYHPVFANLGEQALLKYEIYADNSSTIDPTVSGAIFGYQEAWAEYRFKPTRITGYLGANSGDTVAQKWTYTSILASAPTLNDQFMKQDRTQMDKTFVITNSTYQFIGDFWFNYTAWRAMPYFSIPGLIDHH